jgi:HK97 family phage prohead protease
MPELLTDKKRLRGGAKADDTSREDMLIIKSFYDPKTKTAIASTAVVDRQDESIDQKGWQLDNFKKNDPLLWSHNSYEPLIGNCKNVRVEKMNGSDALLFEPDFHEETDLARAVKALYEQGRLKTFSVGFKPIEMEGNTYTKQELLEISAVNVPANPEAQMLAYQSLAGKGFDAKVIKQVLHPAAKGAVMDELANPEPWKIKTDNMDDVFDIFYAFCEVYFDELTPPEDFQPLLKECISLLWKVSDGSYSTPSDVTASFNEVVDKKPDLSKNAGNKAKETPSAPIVPTNNLTTKQSLTKVIAKAADQALAGQKKGMGKSDTVQLLKIMKRSAEILSKSNKEHLKK